MTYGFEFRRDNQSIIMNNSSIGGVCIDVLTIPYDQASGSKVYGENQGAGGIYFVILKAGRHALSTSAVASNGFSKLNWTSTTSGPETIVAVFAKAPYSAYDTHGIKLYNDVNEIMASPFYTVPQFLATVQPSTTPTVTTQMQNGSYRYTHRVNTGVLGSSDMLVFVMCNLPDSGVNDTWYAWSTWTTGSGGELSVDVFTTQGAAYTVPTLHLYNVNKPPTAPETHGVKFWKDSGDVSFISSDRNMVATNRFPVNYPEMDSTTTYNAAMPVNAAVFLPLYEITDFQASPYGQSFVGVAKRVGNQLTLKTYMYEEYVLAPGEPNIKFEYGSKNGNTCLIVDVSEYGGATAPGGPGGTVQTPPSITSHPGAASVQEGGSYSFSVSATGNPAPSYQWYKDNVAISGATSSTYNGTATAADNGKAFKCYVSNTVSGLFSNPATLSVNTFTAVYISAHPATSSSAQEGSGQTITLYVGASGTGAITYQWYDAGMSGTTYTAISGATGSSYSPAVVSGNNGRRYFCRAQNVSPDSVAYTADSNMGTVYISAADVDAYISQHPSSYTVASGEVKTFYVSVGGTGPYSYQWYSGSTGLISGANSDSISRSITSGSEGFRCYVTGATGAGVYSNYGYLTVGSTPTTSGPDDLDVYKNDPAVFTVDSPGATGYQWYSETGAENPIAVGNGTSSYSAPTSTTGIWQIYCLVSNQYGSAYSRTATLTVSNPPPAMPVITIQPQSQTTTVGQQVYFTVTATGTGLYYQWYRNGATFGSDSDTCAPLVGSTGETGVEYRVNVCNAGGCVMSSTVTITVNSAPDVPVISQQPTGGYVAQFGSKTLYCTAAPVTQYYWYKDGVNIKIGDGSCEVNTQVAGTFSYRCDVYNSGYMTSSDTVIVNVGLN